MKIFGKISAFIKTVAYALVVIFVFNQSVFADEHRHPVLDGWYTALEKADREGLRALISTEAENPFSYTIKDFDIVQNADEFIESMDSWEDAIEGGTIAYKFVDDGVNAYLVTVCYKFSASELLAQEEVTFDADKVASVIQSADGDQCIGF